MEDNFDAQEARKLTTYKLYGEELETVLEKIKYEAHSGESTLYWYGELNYKTIEELKQKGFKVEQRPINGVIYIIKW